MNDPSDSIGSESNAFAFVYMLASELSGGQIDLPSFPDVTKRVRQALQDEDVSADTIRRIVAAEPALAARLLQLANSSAINVGGNPIKDLRVAIARLGFNLVRSSSIAFAMSQLTKSVALRSVREPLRDLWQHNALVAAMASAIAKRLTKVNPDIAALVGILHGIGKLYLLVRAAEYPALFSDAEAYRSIERQWHANIAKALLENWAMADDVVTAVHLQDDLGYTHDSEADLTDVLLIAKLLVDYREHPRDIELNLQGVPAARQIRLDAAGFKQLLTESAAEVEALRSALGN